MSRERARRRAEREAVEERAKAQRARAVARRQRRRDLVRALTPRRRSPGLLVRRSRAQRLGLVLVPLLLVAAVWLLVPDPALRVVLTALLVLVLPPFVVVVLGRRL